MKKVEVAVPAGIRYISEWARHQDSPFNIPDHPCIIDKGLTGCGFTEYCINPQYNNENIILCSPRRMLLENKEEQNPQVLYVRNDYEKSLNVDKDLNNTFRAIEDNGPDESFIVQYHLSLKDNVKNYINQCINFNQPAKILVTYDSFRIVREALENLGLMGNFRVVVDEFQSIFTDASFKAGVELEFVYHLQGIQKLCYVSATPTMDIYLDKMVEFKNLPFYQMNWKALDPLRVIRPQLDISAFRGRSLVAIASGIVQEYLSSNFETLQDMNNNMIESKEVVFYVNSVKNICDIVRRNNLPPDQVNILCARTLENEKKIRTALKSKLYQIGRVPTKGEPRKMFTFCTRTVYLGADFYSDNARTIILSDANIKCLAVDITLDLPQIMGRQRLWENPWKNRAELYAKIIKSAKCKEEFEKLLIEKLNKTKALLAIQSNPTVDISSKDAQKEILIMQISDHSYRHNYVGVNKHAGPEPILVINDYVKIAEERAFEIQQTEYADRFTVFSSASSSYDISKNSILMNDILNDFDKYTTFPDRMKLLCETYRGYFNDQELDVIFEQVPPDYKKLYKTIGPDKLKACSYSTTLVWKAYNNAVNPFKPEDLDAEIYSNFNEGQKLTLVDIKDTLKVIYQNNDIQKTASAIDISNYFETKVAKITLPDKSRTNGLKLIKKLR